MAGNLEFGIRIGGDARGAVNAATQTKQAVEGVGASATKAATDTKKLSTSLEDVVRAGAGLYVLRQVIDGISGLTRIADEFSTVASRIALVTSTSQQSALVQQRLFTIAQSSRVAYSGLAETYARMATATKDLGISQDRLLGVTKTISQAMTIGGGSAESMRAALVQLSQGLASGTLRGEELNSILEQTPRLAQAIAEGMGVGVGELRKLGEQGRITSATIIEALEKTAPKIAAEFAQIAPTVSSAFTTVRDAVGLVVSEFDKGTGASRLLASGMTAVASTLTTIAGSAREAGETLRPVLDVAAWAAFGAASSVALTGIIALLTRLRSLAINPISIAVTVGAAVAGAVSAGDAAYRNSQSFAQGEVDDVSKGLARVQEALRRTYADQGSGRGDASTPMQIAMLLELEAKLTDDLTAAKHRLWEIEQKLRERDPVQAQREEMRRGENELINQQAQEQVALAASVRSATSAWQESIKGVETASTIQREYAQRIDKTRETYGAMVSQMILAKRPQEEINQLYKEQSAAESALKAERDKKIASLTQNTFAQQALTSALKLQGQAYTELQNGSQTLNTAEKALLDLQSDPKWKTLTPVLQEQLKFILETASADIKAADARKKFVEETARAASIWDDGSLGGADNVRAGQAHNERVQREREANDLLEFRLSLIGMEEHAAERLLLNKRYQIQIEQARRALQFDEAAWLEERLEIELEILDANREQNRVKQQNAGAEASYRSMLEEQRRAAEQLNSQITDALMRAFESGKDGAKAFRDTLKNMFATLVLRPAVQFLVTGGVQALGGLGIPGLGGGMGGASTGPGGLGGTINGISGLFGASGLFGGGLSASMATGAGNAALAMGMSGSTALGIAGAAGAVGMAIPYIGIALMAAQALGAFDRGGPKSGGFAQTRGMNLTPFFTEKQGNKSLRQIVNSTESSYEGLARAFGLKPGDFDFAVGYDVDPEGDAGARISAGASLNGQSIIRERVAERVGDDQAAIEEAIAEVTGEALRGALLASDLPEAVKTLLSEFDGTTEEFEAYAIKIAGVNAILETTNVGLQQIIEGLDLTQLEELTDAMGGASQAAAMLTAYMGEFYSAEENLAIASESLAGDFGKLGVEMPKSREGFRQMLESIDLTTESGRELYASLIALAPAFAGFIDATAQAADTLRSQTMTLAGLQQQILGISQANVITGYRDSLVGQFAEGRAWAQETIARSGTGGLASLLTSIDPADFANYSAADRELILDIISTNSALNESLAESAPQIQSFTQAVTDLGDSAADARRKLAEEQAAARASLREFLGGLLTSDISPLNPQQQLDIAAQQYRAAVSSKTGVEKATQNYLDLARRWNPIDFNSVFMGAVRDLGVLGTEPGQSVPQTLQEVVAMLARNVQATAAGSDNVVNAINTQGRGLASALDAWNRVTQRL